MNQCEMLELAAKAAGIEIVPCTCSSERWPFKYADGQGKRGHWSPLEDDGDCARLEAALLLTVRFKSHSVEVGRDSSAVELLGTCERVEDGYEFFGGDKAKARRYASTRVAAMIGRSAQGEAPEQELPDGFKLIDGELHARCYRCDEFKPMFVGMDEIGDPEDYRHYCGGSPRCCP